MPKNTRTLRTIQTLPVAEINGDLSLTPVINGPVIENLPMKPLFTIADADGEAERKAAALQLEIDRLKAENEAIRRAHAKAAQAGLTLKISEKGALSVYGLGRFPTTLYREQWEKLLSMEAEIKGFIIANSSRLKRKGDD